jgi:dTDP-4-dehydrorhamnose reductase
MRILLLGKNGQLGWELNRSLPTLGELTALDYPQIDLTDVEPICKHIRKTRPDVLINATAYTQVDRAEIELDRVEAINQNAPGKLAEACAEVGAAMIHFSTDYVFDGLKNNPYVENDTPNPLNVYGRTKLGGEQSVANNSTAYWIFRTSWVYSMRGSGFVSKVLEWARKNHSLRITADQIGNPTWARMLAEITSQLLARSGEAPAEWIRERRGLYHLAGSGYASRIEWARKILSLDPYPEQQICKEILPAETSEFSDIAKRPLFSALNCDYFHATFGLELPQWELALFLAFNNPE